MTKPPIEMMFDGVEWIPIEGVRHAEDILHATHEGVLHIGEIEVRCFMLSNGQRVIDGDSIAMVFGFEGIEALKSDMKELSERTCIPNPFDKHQAIEFMK